MARLNVKFNPKTEATHEGGPAYGNLTPLQKLRRSLLSCFLWEDTFYENGASIEERIEQEAMLCSNKDIASLAIEARVRHNLRHAPLILLCILAKKAAGTPLLSETIPQVINRADELAELLAVYAKMNGVSPKAVKSKLSAQMKKGIAKAFRKFDAFQLAKYNRDAGIKLRDVMFLCHPKPQDTVQAETFKKLASSELESPDTWEVQLSAGKDGNETFTRLIHENKLGAFALIRNLRNMAKYGVSPYTIRKGFETAKGFEKILPFRYVAAARACPQYEPELDKALLNRIKQQPVLPGLTVVLVDVSGSMDYALSKKSDLKRIDAACALASVMNAEHCRVFSFSSRLVECPPRKGMACIDAIVKSQPHSSTYLGQALCELHSLVSEYDRLIVITDEQTADDVTPPKGKGYMINVASYENGVGYGKWVHIDGFSERVIEFIHEHEKQ